MFVIPIRVVPIRMTEIFCLSPARPVHFLSQVIPEGEVCTRIKGQDTGIAPSEAGIPIIATHSCLNVSCILNFVRMGHCKSFYSFVKIDFSLAINCLPA